jgi:hypothetical protein
MPGNFTASKLRWVKENEPAVYERIYKIMLPGDYIAAKTDRQYCNDSFRFIGRNFLGLSRGESR